MQHSLPSLNSLRAFEAVARHLSYHAAAEELSVTPAAVKQLVSRLESSMGTSLLKRQGRGLVLTAAGRAGLDDLVLAMRYFRSASDKMRNQQRDKQLILSVEPSFSSAWLVPKLAQFRSRYPDINVLIDSSQSLIDLQQSNVDIAVRYGVNDHGECFSARLFDDHIRPACSPSVAADLPENMPLSELKPEHLIHWDVTHLVAADSSRQWGAWKSWLAYFGITDINTSQGLHFVEYTQALQAAIAGQGVILISDSILTGTFQAGLLVCPFKEVASPDIGYDVVCTQAAATRPEVKAFIDWITEAAAQDRSLQLRFAD